VEGLEFAVLLTTGGDGAKDLLGKKRSMEEVNITWESERVKKRHLDVGVSEELSSRFHLY